MKKVLMNKSVQLFGDKNPIKKLFETNKDQHE